MPPIRRLAVAAALLVPLLIPGTAAAADPGSGLMWDLAGAVAHNSETAVACSTATTFWAVEGDRLISTDDGGADWTNRTAAVPTEVADLTDVACARRGPCYAAAATRPAGSEVLVLDGSSVRVSALPPQVEELVSISCPGPLRCVAIDGLRSYTTIDGGASWSAGQFGVSVPSYESVACARGTRSCWVGSTGYVVPLLHSTDLGATWSPVSSPLTSIEAIDCPDVQTCEFTGPYGDRYVPSAMRTTDDGAHFTRSRLPVRGPWNDLSCGTATSCQAVLLGGPNNDVIDVAQTTDGTTWTALQHPNVPSGVGDAVFCISASRCVVLGNGTALNTTDAGATWQIVGLPYGFATLPPSLTGNVLHVLACSSNEHCLTIGTDVFGHPRAAVSDDGGGTWSEHRFPPRAGVITDARCASSTDCVAVGGTGGAVASETLQAYRSDDGGRAWRPGTIAGLGELLDLDCRDAMFCVAIGGQANNRTQPVIQVTRDGGATWSAAPVPDNSGPLSTIACTADSCVLFSTGSAGSSQAWTSNADVSAWTARPLPTTPYAPYVEDLDCTADTCLAVGFHAVNGPFEDSDLFLGSEDGGKTWTERADVLGHPYDPAHVSCSTADSCALTIHNLYPNPLTTFTTTDGGGSWTSHALPPYAAYYQPADITCTLTSCLAPVTGTLQDPIVVAGQIGSP